jgi:metal-dependent amidase/aminoacylase/carboxypeptidase family protein
VLGEVVGADNVLDFEPTMGAEDFSYYLLDKPGCYFLIGNGDGSHREGGHGGALHAAQPELRLQRRADPAGRHRGCAWPSLAGAAALSMDAASHFAPSYAQARQMFLAAADAAGLDVESHPHPLLGRDGEALAMDVVREGARDAKRC